MSVSLQKVRHEVLVFGQPATRYNNWGLLWIEVWSTEANARLKAERFKGTDRSGMVRKEF